MNQAIITSAVAMVMVGLGACASPARKEAMLMNETKNTNTDTNATEDEKLVARVREAVEARIPADGLAAFVGQRPLADTTAQTSLMSLQRVDFAADPEHPDERLDRKTARAVVYWRRSAPGADPHIVGVQIAEGNAASVFFAIILPPG
jgi:hypothetical protein